MFTENKIQQISLPCDTQSWKSLPRFWRDKELKEVPYYPWGRWTPFDGFSSQETTTAWYTRQMVGEMQRIKCFATLLNSLWRCTLIANKLLCIITTAKSHLLALLISAFYSYQITHFCTPLRPCQIHINKYVLDAIFVDYIFHGSALSARSAAISTVVVFNCTHFSTIHYQFNMNCGHL